jgi:predicted DNA-binding transcriptional regulator AlpA
MEREPLIGSLHVGDPVAAPNVARIAMTSTPHLKSAPDADRNLDATKLFPSRKLSVREAAAHLNVSSSWLNKRRLDGTGPRYLKMGRRVTYDLLDLEDYAASRKRQHTSESNSNG